MIMMAMGKTLIMGDASKCKVKEKVLEPKPNAGEKNAQKDEECVSNMEQDVVTSYTKDTPFIARQKLSRLK